MTPQNLTNVSYNTLIKDILFQANTINAPFIVAVDGRCASGKTTLSTMMQKDLGCPVIHMDDFFLRPEQRTPERYAEAGGNVDRERVWQLLSSLSEGNGAVYYPFDCARWELGGPVQLPAASIYLVEGSYSCHPDLRSFYGKTIFLTVTPEVQWERLEIRNPDKLEDFRTKWIPYEEKYFEAFRIMETSDAVFQMDQTEYFDKQKEK